MDKNHKHLRKITKMEETISNRIKELTRDRDNAENKNPYKNKVDNWFLHV